MVHLCRVLYALNRVSIVGGQDHPRDVGFCWTFLGLRATMARRRIGWQVLEPALRKLRKDDLLQVLHDAYQELPASRVVSVFGVYVDLLALESPLTSAKGAAPGRLVKAVERFHTDSLAGQYYESFNVNSKNFMDTSEGTDLWISECNHLFDDCVQLSAKGYICRNQRIIALLTLLRIFQQFSQEIFYIFSFY